VLVWMRKDCRILGKVRYGWDGRGMVQVQEQEQERPGCIRGAGEW
jgi:hypothetical protein